MIVQRLNNLLSHVSALRAGIMTSCAQGQIRNGPEANTFLLITLFCDGTRTQYKRAATKEGDCSCVSASRALLRGQTSSSEACPVTGPRWKALYSQPI